MHVYKIKLFKELTFTQHILIQLWEILRWSNAHYYKTTMWFWVLLEIITSPKSTCRLRIMHHTLGKQSCNFKQTFLSQSLMCKTFLSCPIPSTNVVFKQPFTAVINHYWIKQASYCVCMPKKSNLGEKNAIKMKRVIEVSQSQESSCIIITFVLAWLVTNGESALTLYTINKKRIFLYVVCSTHGLNIFIILLQPCPFLRWSFVGGCGRRSLGCWLSLLLPYCLSWSLWLLLYFHWGKGWGSDHGIKADSLTIKQCALSQSKG